MHESFDSGLPVWRHSRNRLLTDYMDDVNIIHVNISPHQLLTVQSGNRVPAHPVQRARQRGALGTASSGLQPRTGTRSGCSLIPGRGRRGEGPGFADSPGQCPPSTFLALQVLLEHWPQWRDAGGVSRTQLSPEGPGHRPARAHARVGLLA